MGAIDRFRRLTYEDKRLVLRAACAIAATSVGLRVRGLKRMLATEGTEYTEYATEHTEYSEEDAEYTEDIRKAAEAVERAGRYVPGSTCLTRSLALARMLEKRGILTQIRLGVNTDGEFHAHAWVEVGAAGLPRREIGESRNLEFRNSAIFTFRTFRRSGERP